MRPYPGNAPKGIESSTTLPNSMDCSGVLAIALPPACSTSRIKVLRIARREQDLVPRPGPQLADQAADPAASHEADLQFVLLWSGRF